MQRFINNWSATLTAPATSGDLTLSVTPAEAAKLVGVGGGDYYLLTLAEVAGEVETAWEIVKVTAAAGGVLTVVRAQEGTAAATWAVGASISARATAGTLEELRDSGGTTSPELSDSLPLALGAASAGAGSKASREDHRHPLPSAADIGAATSAQGALASSAVQPAALVAGLDGKVDKEPGKGLSEEDFTTALRTKLVGIEPASFRGVFLSFAAMLAGVSSPQPGDYADVDAGAGSGVVRYIWDATDSEWQTGTGGGGPASTDSLPEGATNLYHTADRVRQTTLTGISFVDTALVAATDTVLQAIGKLVGRLATAFDRANHTGEQAISTVTGLQPALSARALVAGFPSRTIAGTADAITPADSGLMLICTSDSPVTLTIGAESTDSWAQAGVLPVLHVFQAGAGAVTITGAGFSVTTHASDTNVLDGSGAAVTAIRTASDTWRLFGRLVAA